MKGRLPLLAEKPWLRIRVGFVSGYRFSDTVKIFDIKCPFRGCEPGSTNASSYPCGETILVLDVVLILNTLSGIFWSNCMFEYFER
jgi:hypothetical protein